ncbi:bifunctional Mitochondrial glycoprotein superfamily/Mitochondrial glycoprotein [Babesia duncani]|uniref:Bifunctional Mitochondrial glycoprotein superfamily/Mitochondrial glycoprotein n=1 Tax=Babesia duncani TaxID=323732 RepID=A0AAD9UNP4_9APIC|nr:bifunctional Mitochondrial glycoprotein superfamily/Mitochondrial glycoprotein [Babesia duncani]
MGVANRLVSCSLRRFGSIPSNCMRFSRFSNIVGIDGRGVSFLSQRSFSTEVVKALDVIKGEIHHENANYEAPTTVKTFLSKSDWKLIEKDGDVNMTLERTAGDKKVTVDFQLVSPFETEGEGEAAAEMTDFSVTVEKKSGEGLTFYCSTLQNDEKFRYMICNVRLFANEAAKNSVSTYNGPDFEDLNDSLQAALDEWLASLGIDGELCDFIDACSIDKEQREYIFWLKGLEKFLA